MAKAGGHTDLGNTQLQKARKLKKKQRKVRSKALKLKTNKPFTQNINIRLKVFTAIKIRSQLFRPFFKLLHDALSSNEWQDVT